MLLFRSEEHAASWRLARGLPGARTLSLETGWKLARAWYGHKLDAGWRRHTVVVRAADAVIMISGGIGTLNELTIAYQDKPTVVLEHTGGWSDRIREIAYGGKHLDEARSATLHFASTPEEAVDLALALAADPTAQPKGAEREFET